VPASPPRQPTRRGPDFIPEDIALKNELVKGGISRDPFAQSRQEAVAEIRQILSRHQIINPLDQQRNTAITNPYAVRMDVLAAGEEVALALDGTTVTVPRADYLRAIRLTRRNVYRGEPFESFDTQSPWVTREIAYPFRFLKQRVASHRELAVLDTLYMLERAVEP
jgi:hypothetical protein